MSILTGDKITEISVLQMISAKNLRKTLPDSSWKRTLPIPDVTVNVA